MHAIYNMVCNISYGVDGIGNIVRSPFCHLYQCRSTSDNDISWLTYDSYEQTESLLSVSRCGALRTAASGDAILFRLGELSVVYTRSYELTGWNFCIA